MERQPKCPQTQSEIWMFFNIKPVEKIKTQSDLIDMIPCKQSGQIILLIVKFWTKI